MTPRIPVANLASFLVLLGGIGLQACSRPSAPEVPEEEPTLGEARPQVTPPTESSGQCPDDMVPVPAGEFVDGATGPEIDFYPDWPGIEHLPRARASRSTGAFCIDRYEYPNRKGEKPRAWVSWDDAVSLCAERERRLCTEDEWAKACAGEEGWLFPYGRVYEPGRCNADVTEGVGEATWIRPAGDFPACVSPHGAFDLEGNLSEWVDAVPEDDDPDLRLLRGGTMWVGVYGRGCMARHRHHHTDATHEDDGFRCCKDQD